MGPHQLHQIRLYAMFPGRLDISGCCLGTGNGSWGGVVSLEEKGRPRGPKELAFLCETRELLKPHPPCPIICLHVSGTNRPRCCSLRNTQALLPWPIAHDFADCHRSPHPDHRSSSLPSN